jgi:hypothetical protein
MSEHRFNNSGGKAFSSQEVEIIKTALVYLKSDFDDEDCESLGLSEDELFRKCDQMLWKINNT